jgi:hypothetical protein
MNTQPQKPDGIAKLEFLAAVLLVLITLLFHFMRLRHAGALWRDEVGVLNLSQMPWRNILVYFPHEAFPPLFFAIIRAYTALAGTGVFAMRLFGALVSMVCLGVFWYNGRLIARHTPLLALALFAFSPLFFVWGDTVRGYGLGAALIALTFGLAGRLIIEPTVSRITALALATVASVHIVMTNAVLVAAIFSSAGIVLLAQKRLKDFALLAGIGCVAALSLLPYAGAYRQARDWDVLVRRDVGWNWMIEQFASALSNPSESMLAVWLILAGLAVIALCFVLWQRRALTQRDITLFLFAFLSLILAPVLELAFLTILKYPTQEWYYLGVVAILIVGFDWMSGTACLLFSSGKLVRLFLVSCIVAVSALRSFVTAHVRMSNIDLAAAYVRSNATADDYIIVVPWYTGISFARVYDAPTPWSSLPPIGDLQLHRYDLCKEQMEANDPLTPVFSRAASSLKAGHSVWIITSDSFAIPSQSPPHLAPAPFDSAGWNEDAYRYAWSMELAYFIQTHSSRVETRRSQDPLTNPFENTVVIQATVPASPPP